MKVSIICPIYNGEKYIKKLCEKIKEQKKINKIELIFPVSLSNDNSLIEAKKYGDIVYEVKNFNHGKTRHEAAQKSNGEYLVFITQDITPYNKFWLFNLIKDIKKEVIAAYSRQIAYKEHGEIENLIRKFNYPLEKRICNKKNKLKNGRKNIFYSDASSAIKRKYYFELGGYDFETPTSEDTVLANIIIENNKTFIYQPESLIYHSHKLSVVETYKRYKDIGRFERIYRNKIDFRKTKKEGKKLVEFVLKNLLRKGKIIDIFLFLLDINIRLIGYRKGEKSE